LAGAFSIEVGGATLAGQRSGHGTPLVLLHGMAGERRDWNRLLAALPADFATLRYDLRGFGQSPAQEGMPYSHADDLLALFDALEIERAPVLGLSMGGGVALNFALSHPERVSRLILISPAMVGWEWSDEWKALWRGVSRAARDGDLALARERWWQHPMFAVARQSDAADELRLRSTPITAASGSAIPSATSCPTSTASTGWQCRRCCSPADAISPTCASLPT
jgi:pimeloyl-ACP methyl ester carboxylesterase